MKYYSNTTTTRTATAALFCLALVGGILQRDVSTSDAFSLMSTTNNIHRATTSMATFSTTSTTSATMLSMAEDDEASAAAEGEEISDAEEEQEEQGPPQDPEVTALKESIAKLESTLADKKSKLQYELEQCEEYSKSGYARKVADMENMKRVRSNIASTSQSSATAAVLKQFLPMYDTLNTLKETYENDEFGAKFSELNLQQTFSKLGVTDFEVQVGEKVNNFRMKVLESEVSADGSQAKDTILRQVAPGMELDGNVIRAALCVSSLGAEVSNDEKAEEGGEESAAAAE